MKSLLLGLILSMNLTGEYKAIGYVTEVNYQRDIVTVETMDGHIYNFGECEDWMVGDKIKLDMDGLGTEEVEDDVITGCQYIGYCEEV